MYVKNKYMKKFLFTMIFAVIFISIAADKPTTIIKQDTITSNVLDEDFFKRELQESVLEFVNDLGLDPDSCYIPFKEEL